MNREWITLLTIVDDEPNEVKIIHYLMNVALKKCNCVCLYKGIVKRKLRTLRVNYNFLLIKQLNLGTITADESTLSSKLENTDFEILLVPSLGLCEHGRLAQVVKIFHSKVFQPICPTQRGLSLVKQNNLNCSWIYFNIPFKTFLFSLLTIVASLLRRCSNVVVVYLYRTFSVVNL